MSGIEKQRQSKGRIDILSRCDMFIVPENLDKIAGILKAAFIGDFTHCFIGVGQAFTGRFDSIIIQVVHGRTVSDLLEVTAEIVWRHIHACGEVRQTDILLIVAVNVFHDLFKLLILFLIFIIALLTEYPFCKISPNSE